MYLIRGTGPYEELARAQEKMKGQPWFKSVQLCDRTLFDAARRVVEYDTGPSWEQVRCPVLVIYGDRDTSSGPPDELVATIRRGLAKRGNDDVTVRIFPSAEHGWTATVMANPAWVVEYQAFADDIVASLQGRYELKD